MTKTGLSYFLTGDTKNAYCAICVFDKIICQVFSDPVTTNGKFSLVPRPLPTQGEGPGTHRLHMRHFIRRFSVKLSVYYSLPRGNSIACLNKCQGKSFCFRWPANCSNKLFAFLGHTRAERKDDVILNN